MVVIKGESKPVKEGQIAGRSFRAWLTEFPGGEVFAAVEQTDGGDERNFVTQYCSSVEEAVQAINEAWADLEANLPPL